MLTLSNAGRFKENRNHLYSYHLLIFEDFSDLLLPVWTRGQWCACLPGPCPVTTGWRLQGRSLGGPSVPIGHSSRNQ